MQPIRFLFLVAIFGLIFAVGSLVAKDADSSESADSVAEAEKISPDDTNENEKTISDVSEKDEKAKAASANQKATSDKEVVKEDKEKSKISDAKEKEKKNPETGSNLPNGDPAANVIRISGDGIRDFFWQVEYLRDR